MVGTPLITDCSLGELSPRMYGRTDQPAYFKGASKMKNIMALPQGGFRSRPGLLLVGQTHSGAKARLVEIIIDSSTAYLVEFTNNYIQFWKNDALVGAVSGSASTYSTAELPELQFAWLYPDLFIAHPNHKPARIRWTTPSTLTLSDLTITTGSYSFTGNTTLGSNVVSNIPIATENLTPLLGVTGTGIPANTIIFVVNVIQGSPDTISITLTQNATANGTGVALTAVNLPSPFNGTGDYPRAVAAAFGRVWWGGTNVNPNSLWGTVTGVWDETDPDGTTGKMCFKWVEQVNYVVKQIKLDAYGNPTTNPPTYINYPNCRQVITDSNGMEATMANTNETVQWISAARDLLIGTASSEWVLPGDATPSTLSVSLLSKAGSAHIQSGLVTGGLVMVKNLGKKVMLLDWQGQGVVSKTPEDLTFFSDHLFLFDPIVDFDYQSDPDQILYFVRTGGTVATCLMDRTFGIQSWSTLEPATGITVESIAMLPGSASDSILPDATRESVYMEVAFGGSHYICKLASPDWTTQKMGVYMDMATYKYNATPFTTMVINAALNGQTLSVVADGAYIGTATVAAGSITLPGGVSANYCIAGFRYEQRFQSMQIDSNADYGTGVMKIKAIPKVRIRFLNSMYAKVGYANTATALDPVVFPGVDVTVASPTLFSGDIAVPMKATYNRDGYVNIINDMPFPLQVTAIVPDVVVTEP